MNKNFQLQKIYNHFNCVLYKYVKKLNDYKIDKPSVSFLDEIIIDQNYCITVKCTLKKIQILTDVVETLKTTFTPEYIDIWSYKITDEELEYYEKVKTKLNQKIDMEYLEFLNSI